MKNGSKQIAVNLLSQVTAFVLSLAINFFLVPVIIEKIGTEIYGFYGLADNFLEYASVLTAVINGMANRYITVAYSRGETENANKYFTSVTLVNIFLTVLLSVPALLLIIFLEHIVNIPANNILDIKCLWTFTFMMFFVNLIFSRYEAAAFVKNRLEITAFINMTSVAAKTILLILAYAFLRPYISYIGITVFLCAVYSAAAKVYFKNKLTPELRFKRELFDFGTVKELAGVGIWNSVSQLSQILFTGLDLLIANIFIGAEEMGILSVAKTIPIMMISFIGVIAGAFYPAMTISYSTQTTKEFLNEIRFASKMCGFVCFVPIMGIVIFGKTFFALWLPTLSAQEINQIQILSVLTFLPQMISIYIFPLYQINTITCRVRMPAVIDCITGALNIVIVYAFLRCTNLGLYAVAGVSSVLIVIKIFLFVPIYAADGIKVSRRTFYPYPVRGVCLNAAVLCVFWCINRLLQPDSWLTLVLTACAAAMIGYAAGFFIIFTKDERKKAAEYAKKKLKRK